MAPVGNGRRGRARPRHNRASEAVASSSNTLTGEPTNASDAGQGPLPEVPKNMARSSQPSTSTSVPSMMALNVCNAAGRRETGRQISAIPSSAQIDSYRPFRISSVDIPLEQKVVESTNSSTEEPSNSDDIFNPKDFHEVELSPWLKSQYHQVLLQTRQPFHPPFPRQSVGVVSEYMLPSPPPQNLEPEHPFQVHSADSIILDPTVAGQVFKSAIFVVPQKAINFTNVFINFSIQVFNLPPGVSVKSHMVDTLVETPSGDTISCLIKNELPIPSSSRNEGDDKSGVETFIGHFRSTEEIGLYNLKVRLVLPFEKCDGWNARLYNDFGVAADMVDILISRNYLRESRKQPATVLSLDVFPFKNVVCRRAMNNSITPLTKAWGLACDKQTNMIYYTDRVTNRVTCMDSHGRVFFQFRQTTPESRLNRPTGICCDETNRRILVCDKGNHRVCIFTMDGHYRGSFGSSGVQNGQFNCPWDVAVNPTGTQIVVSDSKNQRVQLFDRNGVFLRKTCGFERQRPFDSPRGVSFSADGDIVYVTDLNAQNIMQIPIDFSSVKKLAPHGRIVRPQGMVVDSIGELLVCDSRNNCIVHLKPNGQLISVLYSVGQNLLFYPVNVALLQGGYAVVLDGYGQIHIF